MLEEDVTIEETENSIAQETPDPRAAQIDALVNFIYQDTHP